MHNVTYGFMDPARDPLLNSQLFKQLRDCGIKGFKREGVCNLRGYNIPSADNDLSGDHGTGTEAGKLRDEYYQSVRKRNMTIQLPEIQGYFLVAFINGVNLFTQTLEQVSHELPFADFLGGKLTIYGPDWVYDTVIEELHFVMDVFCDFQDTILAPIGKENNIDYRYLADAIAGSFFWAQIGGFQWAKEALFEIGKSLPTDKWMETGDGDISCKVKRKIVHLDVFDFYNICAYAERWHPIVK